MKTEKQKLESGEYVRHGCNNVIKLTAVHCPYCKRFNAATTSEHCPTCGQKLVASPKPPVL